MTGSLGRFLIEEREVVDTSEVFEESCVTGFKKKRGAHNEHLFLIYLIL